MADQAAGESISLYQIRITHIIWTVNLIMNVETATSIAHPIHHALSSAQTLCLVSQYVF